MLKEPVFRTSNPSMGEQGQQCVRNAACCRVVLCLTLAEKTSRGIDSLAVLMGDGGNQVFDCSSGQTRTASKLKCCPEQQRKYFISCSKLATLKFGFRLQRLT